MGRRSSIAVARIVDMLLDEVPEAAGQAEAFSRRIGPLLQVWIALRCCGYLLCNSGSVC